MLKGRASTCRCVCRKVLNCPALHFAPTSYLHIPQAQAYFSEEQHAALADALLAYGESQLGCRAITPIWISYYTDGMLQEMHCDNPHGPFAFVLSLTREGCRMLLLLAAPPASCLLLCYSLELLNNVQLLCTSCALCIVRHSTMLACEGLNNFMGSVSKHAAACVHAAWDGREFVGGETQILQPSVLNYWHTYSQGQGLEHRCAARQACWQLFNSSRSTLLPVSSIHCSSSLPPALPL